MDKSLFSVLSIFLVNIFCFPAVISQQQQVPQLVNHQPSQNIQDSLISVPLDVADTPVTNHYPYQPSSLSPSSNYHQSYPSSSYGSRDTAPPIFGLTGGIGYEISAFLGPVFWFIVAFFAVFGLCVGVSRLIMGTDLFGGMFQRMKDRRSLDLDNVTNMVYQALDTYGKFAAKQAMSGDTESFKG